MPYPKNRMMRQRGWLMIAINDTDDEPAPIKQGNPFYLYEGTSPTTSVSAKSLLQGTQYTSGPTDAGFVTGYRLYTFSGQRYRVYTEDNDGIILQPLDFIANATGWQEFQTGSSILRPGRTFSIFAITDEPDATPTTWTGNWNYTTPQNPGVPASGQISHATKELTSLRINVTDNGGGNRGTELRALTVGDRIQGVGMDWLITAIADNGTWMDFSVSPAQQGAPVGVSLFTFQTITATPIEYLRDTDYWVTEPKIRGLYGINVASGADVVPDANAYGIDLQVQNAYISPDWDIMAYSDELA